MTVLEFLNEHISLFVKVIGGVFVLLVARKPALAYIRTRLEKQTIQLEVSAFEMLRGEIQALTGLLIESRRREQVLEQKNDLLRDKNESLRDKVEDLSARLPNDC